MLRESVYAAARAVPCFLHALMSGIGLPSFSFPMHLRIDEDPRRKHTLAQACLDSFASGMIVLCLLDFVRLALGVPLFAPH